MFCSVIFTNEACEDTDDVNYINTKELKNLKGLQVIHHNVRSLFNKIDTIRYGFLEDSMDLLCFSETWLKKDIPDELVNIDDFILIRNDRQYSRGGGTCIYVRKRLEFENDLIPFSDRDVEIQGVHILGPNGPQKCRCIVLIVVYRPPKGNSANACAKILNFVHNIHDISRKDIILLGDFNWNAEDSDGHGTGFIDEISSEFELNQIIKCPTRIGLQSQTIIDLIFTNIGNIAKYGCLDCVMSDHYPIYLVKKRVKTNTARVEVRRRKKTNYDREVFKQKLLDLDWSLLDVLDDVDVMWGMIYKGLMYELDIMCPYTFVKIRKSKPVWFNGALADLARERDVLFSKYKRGGCKNQELYAQAVRKRRAFGVLVKSSKKTFFRDQLASHCGNQTKFWANMRNLLGQKNCSEVERVYKTGTTELLNPIDSVNEINEFFARVGDRITITEEVSYKQYDERKQCILEHFTPISESTLLDTLKEFNVHKSSGIKDLPTDLLFDAIRVKPDIFVKLCNTSLETGVFPEHCKIARIRIIPKKGDTKLLDNLRPISILSVIGKILEKRVKEDLVRHFEENNLFYGGQFGFRAGRSVHDAVYSLLDFLWEARNAKLYSSVAFLDLSKAFNCVQHSILLEKMEHYGVKGTCLKWISSYLKNRAQFTRINNIISDTVGVESGVPQGSVLGPILYLIYVNDIGSIDITGRVLMFADDSVLIQSSSDPVEAVNKLKRDLTTTSQYFLGLKLKLNKSKTKIMNVDVRTKKGKLAKFPELKLGDVCIETVQRFNYLGFVVDNALKLDSHLRECVKRAQSKIYMLGKLRIYMDKKTALNMFKCMVLPYLEYGNCFLLGSDVVSLKKLQRAQNRGLKVALSRDVRYGTNDLHKEAGLASWEVHARIAQTRLMFKYKYNEEYVEHNVEGRLTRLQMGPIYKLITPRTDRYKNSISYMGRKEWNSLPAYLRCMDSYSYFKKAVKNHYNYLYFQSIST